MTAPDHPSVPGSSKPRPEPVRLAGSVTLRDWQERAVQSWIEGDRVGPYRGTLEIFTGGGKTLIALAAFARVSSLAPDTRLAVVVSTEALARQWVASLSSYTDLAPADVGMLGAGAQDTFNGKRALVAVINSAARRLPELARMAGDLMLVVDECHRAGAATFSKVLATPASYRLALSATPARDEVDDAGLPLGFESQAVGMKIGAVVFRFGLREARETGWLPAYTVHHHGVRLTENERREYDRISRKVTDSADRLTSAGFQTSQAWHLAARGGETAPLAQAYMGALSLRKDFLYRAVERSRVAARLVEQALGRESSPRILLFHERVAEAAGLYSELQLRLPDTPMVLEHSDLSTGARSKALAAFRSGDVDILVSVKSLVEGIDVPDADIGISVAASSSVRQRVQTLGRVLRRRFDGVVKNAEMHVIYVHETVDESIYGKEDWSDLTGADANRYWLWPLDPELSPEQQLGPPLHPRPTEEAEWKRFNEKVPDEPARWMGVLPDYEFSVDTRGNVTTAEGTWIANPQGVASMVSKVRRRPGGRFRVTPLYNLVLVFGESEDGMAPFIAGRIEEPFRLREENRGDDIDVSSLTAGDAYPGPTDRTQGTFKLRQKRGGVIERKQGAAIQFAITDERRLPAFASNARRVIEAWRSLKTTGFTFYVNRLGHAWYRQDGDARFLAEIQSGFSWPEEDVVGGSTAEGGTLPTEAD
jgi:superfamily II DNA or RNA helicase